MQLSICHPHLHQNGKNASETILSKGVTKVSGKKTGGVLLTLQRLIGRETLDQSGAAAKH